MGAIYVTDPATGLPQPFAITGDQPTQEEAARIRNWQSGRQPAPVAAPAPIMEDDNPPGTALGRGLFSGGWRTGIGSALEGIGFEGIGQSLIESGQQAQREAGLMSLADVEGAGDLASFTGEQLGASAGISGQTLAGAGVGALAGSAAGPFGAILGGLAGGAAAAYPIFFGQNREAQKEAQRETGQPIQVDESAAALAAIPQSALDAILGTITLGVGRPAAGIVTRVVRDATTGALVEIPTEVGQQIIEDVQAGRDITSDAARRRYLEAAVAAGLVGSTVGGATGITGPITTSQTRRGEQIEEDLDRDIEQVREQVRFAAQAGERRQEAEEEQAQFEGEQYAMAMRQPLIREEQQRQRDEQEQRTAEFRQYLKDRAEARKADDLQVKRLREAEEAELRGRQAAANEEQIKRTEEFRRRQAEKAAKERQAEFDKAAQERQAQADLAARQQRAVEEQRAAQAKADAERLKRIEKRQQDMQAATIKEQRRVQQAAKKVTPEAVNDADMEMPEPEVRRQRDPESGAMVSYVKVGDKEVPIQRMSADEANGIGGWHRLDKGFDPQTVTYVGDNRADAIRSILQDEKGTTSERNSIVANAKMAAASRSAEVPTALAQEMRSQLDRAGLKDVTLDFVNLINKDAGIEGVEQARGERSAISLAMDIYDPQSSDQELAKRLGSVLNHEIIHSLRTMDLFNSSEFSALSKAAANQKRVVDGQRRNYSYLDYQIAKNNRLDPSERLSSDAVVEEAIAEMYRDYAAGNLKLAGKPQGLIQKIVRFIKAIGTAGRSLQFEKSGDLFNRIREGEIGARERGVNRMGQRIDDQTNSGRMSEIGGRDVRRDEGYRREPEAPLDGAPRVEGASGPDRRLVAAAEKYAADNGIDLRRQAEFVEIDPDRASRIAEEYDKMVHNPDDPQVAEAYSDLIRQTVAQYRALEDAGYQFYFFDPEGADPYADMKGGFANPWNAMRDLRANQRMAVFPTDVGFGTLEDTEFPGNPLLQETDVEWAWGSPDGPRRKVRANDLFRAVHDAFGHGIEGAGFRARGEENAWQAHVRLFNGPAVAAITTETRGQNSWLNYGPYGEQNRNASVDDTVFADQKTGLMPEWTWLEGRAADMPTQRYSRVAGNQDPMQVSSAFVQSKNFRGDRADPDTVAGLNLLEPKNIKAAADLIKSYGILPTRARNPERVVEEYIDFVSENLVDIYNRVPSEVREETKRWYEGANRIAGEFAERFDTPRHVVAAMIARTSPKSDWHVNVARVERMLDIITNGRDIVIDPAIRAEMESNPLLEPSIKVIGGRTFGEIMSAAKRDPDLYRHAAHFMRGIDQAYNPSQTAMSDSRGRFMQDQKKTFSWMETKFLGDALRLYNNQSQQDVSNIIGLQHKVRSFYNNILAPNDPRGNATIDTHAVAIGVVQPLGQTSPMVEHNFKAAGVNNSVTGSMGMYPVYLEAYKRAAERVGVLPRELQSITWEAARGLMPSGGKKALKPFATEQWKQFKAGKKTRQEVIDEVLERAGGTVEPNWWGHRLARDDEGWGTSYESGISQAQRRDGGDDVTGTGSRDARDVSERYSRVAEPSPATGTTAARNQIETRVQHSITQRLVGRAMGKILGKDMGESLSDAFFTLTQDSFLPVGRMIDKLREGGLEVADAYDAYLQEMLKHGKVGARMEENTTKLYEPTLIKVNGVIVDDARMEQLRETSDYVKEREKAAENDRNIIDRALGRKEARGMIVTDAYLYALHAKERNAYIKEQDPDADVGSGMTDEEADAIIAWVENDAALSNRLGQIRDDVQSIVRDTNKMRVESGLIPEGFTEPRTLDDGTVEYDNRVFENYVPLRGKRGEDGSLTEDTRTGTKRPLMGREDKQLKGRNSIYAGESPLVWAMTQNAQTINRSESNKVVQSFANLIRENSDELSGMAKMASKRPEKDAHSISFKENGETKYIYAEDPRLARAFDKTLNPDTGNVVIRKMYSFNRMLSQLITTYNPEFLFTNFPRDVETALVNASQYEIDGVRTDLLKGVPKSMKAIYRYTLNKRRSDEAVNWADPNPSTDQLVAQYQEYIGEGGKQLVNEMADIASAKEKIKQIVGENTTPENARQQAAKVLRVMSDGMEGLNEVGENASRFAFYRALRMRGVAPSSAASAARNLTTNFSKKGELANFMGAWSMFYNASLQGSMAMINAAARSKKARAALGVMVATGLVMDQLNALFSEEDETGIKGWDRLQEYELEHNLMIPDFQGGYISIPLAYGLNNFYNVGRNISRVLRGAASPGQATSSIWGTTLEIINPLGDDHSMVSLVSPTIADPFINIAQNEDFTGRAIYKEAFPGDPGKSRAYQHWNSTSPVWQNIAQSLNDWTGGNEIQPGLIDFSPDVAEFLWNHYTGGLGRFIDRSVSLPSVAMDPTKDWDGSMIEATPMLRRLYTAPSTRGDLGLFLDKFNVVRLAREEYKEAAQQGDERWKAKVRTEKGKLLQKYIAANGLNQSRLKIIRRRNQIMAAPIPESQKIELLRQLADAEQEIIKRGLTILKDVK